MKVLGTGTYGTVSLAEDLTNKNIVALKEIFLNQTSEDEVREEVNLNSLTLSRCFLMIE